MVHHGDMSDADLPDHDPDHDATVTQPSPSAMRRCLKRAEQGQTLSVEELATLLQARGEDLDRLCAAAARRRDARLRDFGRLDHEHANSPRGVLTYSRKVFIPLTRLCRDRCHYCTFVATPPVLRAQGESMFLEADEVLAIAREGAAAGAKEALFTLGDRPEDRWPEAREWLEARGYDSTLAYVRAMAIRVLEETGLLPHLNPGVMSWAEISRLKPVAPSMGMMLETSARRLFTEPGQPHYGSPDKDPEVRLRCLTDAGRVAVPFTTGILVGIGETPTERAQSLLDIARLSREFGHIQEVIVQNFRAKEHTAMARTPDAALEEYRAAIAGARLVLDSKVAVQAPPNLVEAREIAMLIGAGIDDFGGISPVTRDHVNPERPWPEVEALATQCAELGFTLRERLTVHPRYIAGGATWIDPRVAGHVAALAGPDGLAAMHPDGSAVHAQPRPWQEPDEVFSSTGRADLGTAIDEEGRRSETRSDLSSAFGNWDMIREAGRAGREHSAATAVPERSPAEIRAALRAAERNPEGLSDEQYLTLATATGDDLAALAALADQIRHDVVGDEVTYIVNRNINFSNICYTGCRFCAFAQRKGDADAFSLSPEEVAERAYEAHVVGATEVCMQGGIDPDLPVTGYADLVRAVKKRIPSMHVHAFSPMEISNGVSRSGTSVREWLSELKAAGLDSIPGTAAEILDDDVRWILTKGKLPAAEWISIVETAHELGIRSSSTMMYGHVDNPRHWVAHLRTLRGIQERTGGFTEFVPLPFVHHSAPLYLAGAARPGPTRQENVVVHALARLMLHGAVDNVQTSWVKLGETGTQVMLRSGANDLGGTLMEETISRMAGSDNGSAKTPAEIAAIGKGIGRTVVQRDTFYRRVRTAGSSAQDAESALLGQPLPLHT